MSKHIPQQLLSTQAPYCNQPNLEFLVYAEQLAQQYQRPVPECPHASSAELGLMIATELSHFINDNATLAAALLYPTYVNQEESISFNKTWPTSLKKLMESIQRFSEIYLPALNHNQTISTHNKSNVRKMLLAFVDDARVVLIKLIEQLCLLKLLRDAPSALQQKQAQLVMDIYAPLANRLGIGQLKWQLEDFAFRYLNPDAYTGLKKSLNMRRQEREKFVNRFIETLRNLLETNQINHYDISGRAKHIYSIYRKQTRKQVNFEEIYDAIAVRVLVDDLASCYTVLSLVHAQWEHIPKEFDDYIAHPKPNGYRSIHTAITVPQQPNVEIQIRTFNMHEEAELGLAAHWLYKEGNQVSLYAHKINALRQVFDWQNQLTTDKPDLNLQNISFDEDVYVFTPQGEIVALPQGATPLDFAYHIHSDIGHRCRGAKVNDKLVPLTHQLTTGDHVSIITTREGAPSRDWLNPQAKYIVTTRARSKILHYFKQENHQRNLQQGLTLFEKHIHRLGHSKQSLKPIAKALNYSNTDALLAALGSGDVAVSTILHQLTPAETTTVKNPPNKEELVLTRVQTDKPAATGNIMIEGEGDLLVSIAQCCRPLPGDTITGYITKGRGVTIHRTNCRNLAYTKSRNPERLINVKWGNGHSQRYLADITIEANDRKGLVRDISSIIANQKLSIHNLHTFTNHIINRAYFKLTIEVNSPAEVTALLAYFKQLPDVISAERKK